MAVVESHSRILEEIAELLASNPSREQLLRFRPSETVQHRASALLERLQTGQISPDEERELGQFEQAELLMRLVKAKLRAQSEQ